MDGEISRCGGGSREKKAVEGNDWPTHFARAIRLNNWRGLAEIDWLIITSHVFKRTETSVTCTLACYAKIQARSFRSPEVLFFVFCRTVETSRGYIILPTFHFALDNTKAVDRTNVDSKTSVALNSAYKCRVLFLYHYKNKNNFFILLSIMSSLVLSFTYPMRS